MDTEKTLTISDILHKKGRPTRVKFEGISDANEQI